MSRIKKIIMVSIYVVIIAAVVFIFVPKFGWMFSLGLLVGGAFAIFDFWVIVRMVAMLKKAADDPKLMTKFALLFIAKTFLLLLVLGIIVFILARIGQIITFGFIGGLLVIPLSIVATAFSKKQE